MLEAVYTLKLSKNTKVYEFFNLIKNINLNTEDIFSQKNLISAFTKICRLFSFEEQPDSQRFYRNLEIIFEKELGIQILVLKILL